MSYPLDVAAQSAALDALLGDNAASTVPTSFEVAIFDGSPLAGGVELDSTGGYARAVVANTSAVFPDAVSGQKVSATISFAAPSAAWSDTGTDFVLYDAADSTTAWFFGRLLEEIAVDGTETGVAIQLALYWNTGA
jgi:hypothetical protein